MVWILSSCRPQIGSGRIAITSDVRFVHSRYREITIDDPVLKGYSLEERMQVNPPPLLVNPLPVLVNPLPVLVNPPPVLVNPLPVLVNPPPVMVNPPPVLVNLFPVLVSRRSCRSRATRTSCSMSRAPSRPEWRRHSSGSDTWICSPGARISISQA
jgi:hypothetical protein